MWRIEFCFVIWIMYVLYTCSVQRIGSTFVEVICVCELIEVSFDLIWILHLWAFTINDWQTRANDSFYYSASDTFNKFMIGLKVVVDYCISAFLSISFKAQDYQSANKFSVRSIKFVVQSQNHSWLSYQLKCRPQSKK